MHPPVFTPDPATFYPLVWSIVRQVPPRRATTYAQVASMLPAPDPALADEFRRLAPKWVGEALNAVSFRDVDGQPLSPGVPWWRVVNSKGGISLPQGSRAAAAQVAHLRDEGVLAADAERVDLAAHGWDGPPDAWREDMGLLPAKPLPGRAGAAPPPEVAPRDDAAPSQPPLF